jgi:SNF2 family DNA or RNA helicase
VPLKDGSFGVVPEDWLDRYGALAGLGEAQHGSLRFRRNQVGLLDALLASQPEARVDEAFARARAELRAFEGIAPEAPPASFQGELRPYQREGLGWLRFLRRFGFGGCLADDMGLGKTVQVLALLEALRAERGDAPAPGPTLVVVPRSLVFNWRQEAARFAPGLRVLDHSRYDRDEDARLDGADVVLTTYGTLRRDILKLKEVRFDLVVLDEAQAIKNAGSESAKAVRLLQATHRLALSGTPVENHLRELWSLFEFLNPGMLGSGTAFGALIAGSARDAEPEARELLAAALRPFILRRTKEKVAPELPEKLEQTIWCELEADHRRLYDELRDHYRRSLLPDVAQNGIARSKFQVLEALLRLRQAACHPGLLDAGRRGEAGAKLDALVPQVTEVMEEGHKVLVFSQFTSLLAILRERLDGANIAYEYLDGHTRDRAARVTRFQEDAERRLFLISLKAGGLGLNLTAAEYVFLLDPWWNPAVEAQAIDRAHRIGQTRRVFAYRLIARDTVEEKVLELQEKKRSLADAILNADQSLIRDLTREDLELLLS